MKKLTLGKIGKWTGITGAVVGGFVLLSGFGPGQRGWRSPDKIDKLVTFKLNDMLDDIGATPAQREKVLAAKDKVLGDFLKNRDTNRQTREAMVAQWKSDQPDAKAIHAAIDARIEQMRALAHEAADQALEIHEVLTPAQREPLAGRFAGGRMFEP